MSRAAFEARFPDVSLLRYGISSAKRWPDGFVMPRLRPCQGLGTEASPGELGMCGLREGDFGDRRHDHAPQPLAPEDLVHGQFTS